MALHLRQVNEVLQDSSVHSMVAGAGSMKWMSLPERQTDPGAEGRWTAGGGALELKVPMGWLEGAAPVRPATEDVLGRWLGAGAVRGDSKSARDPGELTTREIAEEEAGEATGVSTGDAEVLAGTGDDRMSPGMRPFPGGKDGCTSEEGDENS